MGVSCIKNKRVIPVCFIAFFVNLILFGVKLYVGLSSNSISIYSDGINNLFDSLSGILSVVCLALFIHKADFYAKSRSAKTEQLLSFVLSVSVGIAGFVFLYSSVERLMYPTPLWFQLRFLYTIIATAFVKLIMFLFLNNSHKKLGSVVIRIMAYDSLLDFFITAVTAISFIASAKGVYAVDSFCGILISVIVLISAFKLIKESIRKLMNTPEQSEAELIEEILLAYGITPDNSELVFCADDKQRAFIVTDTQTEKTEEIKRQISEKTGTEIYFAK